MMKQLSFKTLALLLAAFFLGSCNSGSTAPGSSIPQTPQPPALDSLPALEDLGEAPTSRIASEATISIDFSVGGFINSTMEGEDVRLASPANHISASINGMTPQYTAGVLAVPYLAPYELHLSKSGTGEYWVAIGDYGKGRWRVLPEPFTEDELTIPVTLTANAGSPNGTFWFAVITHGGNDILLEEIVLDYPDAPLAGQPLKYEQYIEMSDGAQLATDIYLPFAETSPFIPDPPYPAALIRTPYDKANFPADVIAQAVSINTVVIAQYFRGRLNDTGALPDSTGVETLFREHAGPEHFDAIETMDWIEARTFYNGTIAATGPSALGLWIYQSMPQLGERLDAGFMQVSAMDTASWGPISNGCFSEYNMLSFAEGNGYPETVYSDLVSRFESGDAEFFAAMDFEPRAGEVRTPGFHETGWWDVDVEETISSWRVLNTQGGIGAAGQQKLVIGPWTHNSIRTNQGGSLTFPLSGDINDPTVLPAGWDGIEWLLNRIGRNPFYAPPANSVLFYMVGPNLSTEFPDNRWHELSDWPPPPDSEETFYLVDGLVLEDNVPQVAATVVSLADPEAAVPTTGGALLEFGPLQAGPRLQDDLYALPNVLSFRSSPLVSDMPVVGPINITLFLEVKNDDDGSQPLDLDISARLVDDGLFGSMLVADNIMRLSHYTENIEEIGSVEQNTVYEVSFEIGQRAYNFAAGNQIGLDLTWSNAPRFAVNPQNGDAFYDESNGNLVDVTVHMAPDKPSRITVPVYMPVNPGP